MKFSELDLCKNYFYHDYYRWDFDERVELIKGKVFVINPVNTIHQRVSACLSGQLYNYLKYSGIEAFAAPFDVRLQRKSNEKEIYTVVQPDICVICDPSKIDEKGCLGALDIVVEILSKGNNKKELKNKYEVYEEAGVTEYWIIHPEEKTFLKYTLDNAGKYQPSHLLTLGDDVTNPVLSGFVLSLEDMFSEG